MGVTALIGIFGLGRMGRHRAQLLDGHELIVSSRSEPDDAPGRWLPVEQALEAPLDAAIVATATASHADLVEQLVRREIPVLCEKPLAVTISESRRLAALIGDFPVQMAFQRRQDPGFRTAFDAVRDGTLGTLYSLSVTAHDATITPEDYLPTSGGIFRDMHVHDFDLVRWLTGEEIEQVFALGAVRVDDRFARHDDVDTTVIALRTASGVPISISGARHQPLGHDIRAELFGSKDTLSVGLTAHSPLHAVEGHTPEPPVPEGFLDRFDAAFRAETELFLAVARGEAPNPCTAADAVAAFEIAEACERSRREGRAVSL